MGTAYDPTTPHGAFFDTCPGQHCQTTTGWNKVCAGRRGLATSCAARAGRAGCAGAALSVQLCYLFIFWRRQVVISSNGKRTTMAEAVARWYFEDSTEKWVDGAMPPNPTC